MDKGSELLVVDCGNELLPTLHNAHYLPTEVSISRDSAVADAALVVFTLVGGGACVHALGFVVYQLLIQQAAIYVGAAGFLL